MGFWQNVKKTLIGSAPEDTADTAHDSSNQTAGSPPAADSIPGEGYKAVLVCKGAAGWGGPLTIAPNNQRKLVYSVTGGGIHPVAQRIADLTGAIPFDGFKSKADFSELACAVIDCGGTARVGVYPMKGVPTVDIHAATPSGPLMKYINEQNFVSGVTPDKVVPVE